MKPLPKQHRRTFEGMTQCRLRKLVGGGGAYMERMEWLPNQFAVPGKVLKLKDSDGQWTDNWIVQAVYEKGKALRPSDDEREMARIDRTIATRLPTMPEEESRGL